MKIQDLEFFGAKSMARKVKRIYKNPICPKKVLGRSTRGKEFKPAHILCGQKSTTLSYGKPHLPWGGYRDVSLRIFWSVK